MNFTVRRSFLDRFVASLARAHAGHQLRRFLRAASRAADVQRGVLRDICLRMSDSDFGRQHDLGGVRSHADLVERVPIQDYEAIRPFVNRVMSGETRALLGAGNRVLMFATTSGTTNQPKYVPVTDRFLREYRRGWNVFGLKALLDHPDAVLRGILQVVSPIDERQAPCGLPCGAISGLLAATQKRLVRKYYVLPSSVGQIEDAEARYYTIARVALSRDVAWLITASPATQLKVAKTISQHAESLIRDIHDGSLSPPGPLGHDVRTSLLPCLRPDVVRANALQTIANRHGALRASHCWNLSLLSNWTGGTMGLHLRDFPEHFGDTPVRDIGLLATEGRVTIPFDDATPAGVLDVQGAFFEFIETDASGESPAISAKPPGDAIRLAHELEVDREYRVVMTTWAGFVRYDLGDFVRVRGFLGQAPVLEFLHRGAHVSSMTGEKLTEKQVVEAYELARTETGLSECLFVLSPVWGDPPRYRLFVQEPCGEENLVGQVMDEILRRANVEYASKRASGRLGDVAVVELPNGSLDGLDAELRSRRGASNEQFKHRYLLSKPGEDDVLMRLASTPASTAVKV